MLLKLSVPVIQVILSFVIPLVSLFLILWVIVSQLNLLVNLLMWTGNVLVNDLVIIRTVTNMILQNHLVLWILDDAHLFLWINSFIFHHNVCNNNVDNFFKVYVKCNNFSTNKFLTSNSVAISNIQDKNFLSSSVHFYEFSFSFYEYLFFINSVFYMFNKNSVTNILNNDFYITYI